MKNQTGIQNHFETIIFDLGGVLVDWEPAYLYASYFEDKAELDWFLKEVCSPAWNNLQDAGRSFEEGTQILLEKYPNYEKHIRAFYDEWETMLKGSIKATEQLLYQLHKMNRFKLYALTNWSAETFPIAVKRFDFLSLFLGIVVSGEEKLVKPDPAIYEILIQKFNIDSKRAIYIDDSKKNVLAAKELGFAGIHYVSTKALKEELAALLGIEIYSFVS